MIGINKNHSIPKEWSLRKLHDVAAFKNGKGHEKFIDEDGQFVVVNSKFISTEGQVRKFSNKNLSPLKKEIITLVMSDIPNGKALGKCYFIEKDDVYTLNQRICSIKSKSKISPQFLYYLLNRNQYFLAFNNGVGQTNLKKDEVLNCPIPLPPLPEQQKIADILSTIDAKITMINQQIASTEELKKGLMQRLLTKGIGHTEFKDSPLGEIPKSWKVKRIGDSFEFISTKSLSRAQLNYEEGDVFYIHYGDIHSYFEYPTVDLRKIIIPRINPSNKLRGNIQYLKQGDLLLADASEDMEGVGMCIEITDLNNKDVIGGLHTIVLREISNKTVLGFRTYLLRSPFVLPSIKRIATGASVLGVSKGNLKNILIAIPSVGEQKKMSEIFTSFDSKLKAQKTKKEEYQQLKKGLMQQLLTGKIRVNNLIEA